MGLLAWTNARRRAARPAVIVGAVVAAWCLLAPTAASAHAYLLSTTPAIGGVVRSSPPVVSLTYDESVTISSGALEVFDSAGKRVDAGVVMHPRADTIAVAIPRALPRGSYAVAWRVTSADTHVVHGVFTFSVGRASAVGALAGRLLARGRTSGGLAFGFGVVRFANLLLLLLCGGGAAALVLVLHDADERIQRPLRRTLVVGSALLALFAALGLPFEAAEATGSGLGGGFAAGALAAVRGARFGEAWLVRAWLAVALALVVLTLELAPRRARGGRELVMLTLAIALLLTPSAAGHASVGSPYDFAVDAAHVITAAAWLGGLAFVLVALRLSPAAERWSLAARSVPRFSLLALVAVSLLLAAGILNAIHEVAAWRGLWQSTYGELVLAKVALALPLLALGAFNNRVVVPALRAGALAAAVRARFVRAALAELALAAVIVGVTAALIAESPARNEVELTSLHTTAHPVGPYEATVHVRPLVVGRNTITITVTTTRRPPPVIGEVDLAADPPTSRLAPLNLNVVQRSATGFGVSGALLTVAGTWHLDVTVRSGLTEYLARIPITVQPSPTA